MKIKLENIQIAAAGNNHSLFLTTENKIYGCGDNSNLQLGDAKHKKNVLEPKKYLFLF